MSDPNREGPDDMKARQGRNIAMAIGLVAFVILIFAVTIVKLGGNAAVPHF